MKKTNIVLIICNNIIVSSLIILLTCGSSLGNNKLSIEDARKALARLHISYDEASFYEAVSNDDIAIVDLFLLSGMDPNTIFSIKDENVTPLIVASYNNNIDLVKLLLARGADSNYQFIIKANEAANALYYSIAYLNYAICKLLLEHSSRSPLFIKNISKGNELLTKMLHDKKYISPLTKEPSTMDDKAQEKAQKILELLKKFSVDLTPDAVSKKSVNK
jgi:hypothetical protein